MGYGRTNAVSLVGGGNGDFYKCASVNTSNQTWTGYKAILVNGAYNFQQTVTSGLSYGDGFIPIVDKIYTDGALAIISGLYSGLPIADIFDATLTSSQTVSGETIIVFDGNVSFNVTQNGIAGAYLDYGCLKYPLTDIPSAFTLAGWIKTSGSGGFLLAIGKDGYSSAVGLWIDYSGYVHIEYGTGGESPYSVDMSGAWHHFALTKSEAVTMYIDGIQRITGTNPSLNVTEKAVYIGGIRRSGEDAADYVVPGYYSTVRLYSRVLSSTEIASLASEYTPTP